MTPVNGMFYKAPSYPGGSDAVLKLLAALLRQVCRATVLCLTLSPTLLLADHFNSPPNPVLSVLSLPHCRDESQCKLEEQLIFWQGSL